jgi:hypothetical protein
MLLASDVGTPIPSNFAAHLRVNLTIVSSQMIYLHSA